MTGNAHPDPRQTAAITRDLAAASWDNGPVRRAVLADLDAHATRHGQTLPSRALTTPARPGASTDLAVVAATVQARADEQRLARLTRYADPALGQVSTWTTMDRIRTKIASLRARQEALPTTRTTTTTLTHVDQRVTATQHTLVSEQSPRLASRL